MTTQQSTIHRFEQWATNLLAHHQSNLGEVYQSSTISALLDGVNDGDVTVADILRHGDFGLGTFNRLDGEMVILDGVCYHLYADGTATQAAPTHRTPFAAVTHFRTDFDLSIRSSTGRANVFRAIDAKIASTNLIYAIRVTGRFTGLHTRTVMAQTPPYPPLTTATKDQTETVFEKAAGTIVGFRTPDFEQGISVAGYHLHFLSGDHAHGGHVLDFAVEQGQISVSTASQLHLSLPTTEAFLRANLSGPDLSDQIQRVEGGASPPHP
jgi:alpha-acetolactate decarboxylase